MLFARTSLYLGGSQEGDLILGKSPLVSWGQVQEMKLAESSQLPRANGVGIGKTVWHFLSFICLCSKEVSRHQTLPVFTKGCLWGAFPLPHLALAQTPKWHTASPLSHERRLETSSASLFLTLVWGSSFFVHLSRKILPKLEFSLNFFLIFSLPSRLLKFLFCLQRSWSHSDFK